MTSKSCCNDKPFSNVSGEVTGATNVGTGEDVFQGQSNTTLVFKTLTAGSGITLTPSTDELEITSTSSGGTITGATNLGAGNGVFAQVNGTDLEFKSITGSNGSTITNTATEINVDSIDWTNASDDLLTSGFVRAGQFLSNPASGTNANALNIGDQIVIDTQNEINTFNRRLLVNTNGSTPPYALLVTDGTNNLVDVDTTNSDISMDADTVNISSDTHANLTNNWVVRDVSDTTSYLEVIPASSLTRGIEIQATRFKSRAATTDTEALSIGSNLQVDTATLETTLQNIVTVDSVTTFQIQNSLTPKTLFETDGTAETVDITGDVNTIVSDTSTDIRGDTATAFRLQNQAGSTTYLTADHNSTPENITSNYSRFIIRPLTDTIQTFRVLDNLGVTTLFQVDASPARVFVGAPLVVEEQARVSEDSTAALEVTDASGLVPHLTVDTTNNTVTVENADLIYDRGTTTQGYYLRDSDGSGTAEWQMIPMADIYSESNTLATSNTSLPTPIVMSTTVTLNPDAVGSWATVTTSNRVGLQYTGSITGFAHIGSTLSIDGGNGSDYTFSMAKNGTKMPGSKIVLSTSNNVDKQSTAIHCMSNITTNDVIEIYLDAAPDSPIVTDVNIFAMIL